MKLQRESNKIRIGKRNDGKHCNQYTRKDGSQKRKAMRINNLFILLDYTQSSIEPIEFEAQAVFV